MKKIYLLLLSFVCLCSLSVYADSPCDSEIQTKARSNYARPCQKPCAKHAQKYHTKTYQTPCAKPCEKPCTKPCQEPCHKAHPYEAKCPQTYKNPCPSECFLCTNKNMNILFRQMGLSETQICTARKIQEKYELEVLSINDRLQCEEANLCSLNKNCAKKSEIRREKRKIKDLKKTRKEICKCYEKQFKALLSNEQKRAYRKYKKCS